MRRIGSTILLERARIAAWAAAAGKKESEGPLGLHFDVTFQDDTLGLKSWEEAESGLQRAALERALQKAGRQAADIQALFAGDLLNQDMASTFGLKDFNVPFIGQFSACGAMAQTLGLAALLVDGGGADVAAAVTSSHFCGAERQFRYPLEYGAQRPPTAQWTATAAGAVVVERAVPSERAGAAGENASSPLNTVPAQSNVPTEQNAAGHALATPAPPPHSLRVRGVTFGRMVDMGVKDAGNMGAAMAPAAADTIRIFLKDTGKKLEDFNAVATGDLAAVGSALLLELLPMGPRHIDCGLLLYDRGRQDVGAGGSGCGCSAAVLCATLLGQLASGAWHDLLFVGTGAMTSLTSSQQGMSIPGIAHAVWIGAE